MSRRRTGEWRCNSTILIFGTRQSELASFMIQSLYHRGRIPLYPLRRSLGGPQNRSGLFLYLAGNLTRTVQPAAHVYTD
jgi:hypothetical protein